MTIKSKIVVGCIKFIEYWQLLTGSVNFALAKPNQVHGFVGNSPKANNRK